jgi:hypothetical protein
MGREVRRVHKDWRHPFNEKGNEIPLFGRSFSKALADWKEGKRQWDLGFVKDWGKDGGWKPKPEDAGDSFDEWDGGKPVPHDYMPEWETEDLTHIQMYETCTEGTPISPVMETPEELARWLADNGASAFGSSTASYEAWLSTIKRGWAPSAIASTGTGLRSGVEALEGK